MAELVDEHFGDRPDAEKISLLVKLTAFALPEVERLRDELKEVGEKADKVADVNGAVQELGRRYLAHLIAEHGYDADGNPPPPVVVEQQGAWARFVAWAKKNW